MIPTIMTECSQPVRTTPTVVTSVLLRSDQLDSAIPSLEEALVEYLSEGK